MGNDIFSRVKRKYDPGDCGAPCSDEKTRPRRPLSDMEIERQRKKFIKGPW